MPSWKKVLASGSDASFSSVSVDTFVSASSFKGSFTGSLQGTSSQAISSSYALTASYALNGGGGGISAIYIQDEGATQGTASYFNFTGAGVTATVSNSTASINIPGGGSGAGFPFTGSAQITGSLGVTGSINSTGNITTTGTLTAQTLVVQTVTSSIIYSSGSNIFGNSTANTQQFTGSVLMTGSLNVLGNTTITGSLNISGSITGSANARFLGSITSSAALISGSGTQRLVVVGSGSAQPIFTVQGSQGELFSVTDNLSGSLFSVNDLSGLPILEVFSDNTTLVGSYLAPALNTTNKITTTNSGSFVIYSVPTSSYDGVFVDYTAKSGSSARAGVFAAIWSGSSVNYMDNSTTDFGNTSLLTLAASISGGNMVVTGSVATGSGWTVKAIIRSI